MIPYLGAVGIQPCLPLTFWQDTQPDFLFLDPKADSDIS
jgi:hypothetical protein